MFFFLVIFVLLIIGLILDYEFFDAKPPIVSLFLLLVWVSSEADLEISIWVWVVYYSCDRAMREMRQKNTAKLIKSTYQANYHC